ncbi:unnamed protein product, partial [Prorocentrum cordatum]
DDDGYWYEWDDERGDHACTDQDEEGGWDSSRLNYLEDDADAFLAGEDDEYHQTVVTMREGRLKMNTLRAARRFFKGKIDGGVDESAAAGGHAAGKSFGKGKGKGKDGGKSKDKWRGKCGRMDHHTSECPTGGSSGKPATGKGRGKGAKSVLRPRRLGFWAMSPLVVAVPSCLDVRHQMRGHGFACANAQPEEVYGIMMVNMDSDPVVLEMPRYEVMISNDVALAPPVDIGASIAAAGRGWLDRVETELAKYGFKPIKTQACQNFKGLGGARRESKQKWTIPVGIGRKHVLQECFETPRDMIGLASRKDLAEWKTNLLRARGRPLRSRVARVGALFEQFRVDGMAPEPEALKNGSNGIFKKSTLERIDKLMKKHSAISDALRDSQKTQSDVLLLIMTFEPWLFSVAFPCVPFSNVQEFQCARGTGGRVVGDHVEAFRPSVDCSVEALRAQAGGRRVGIDENRRTSRAWAEGPIMDLLVTLRQCMFGLAGDYGAPIKKATRVLVPNGPCFSRWLDRARDRSREYAVTAGRGTLPSPASAWPDDLGKTLASAGARELARRTDMRKLGIWGSATKFKLRKDLVDVRVLRRSEAISLPRGAARRIYATHADKGVLADFSDARAGDPGCVTIELAARRSSRAISKQMQHVEVLDAVDKLGCVVRKGLGGPNAARTADLKLSAEFNENVMLDEAELFLSDKTRRVVMVIRDAWSFRVIIPFAAVPSITGVLRCLSQGWLSWVGPPKVLFCDAAKGRVAQRFVEIGEKCNILPSISSRAAPSI